MLSDINPMERTEKVTPFYQQQQAGGVRQQQLAGGVRQQQQQAGLEGVRVPQQDLGYAKEIRSFTLTLFTHILFCFRFRFLHESAPSQIPSLG
jgi:hypothetical protein